MNKSHGVSLMNNKPLILMSVGLVLSLTSPCMGLYFYPSGGMNAFWITCVPLFIGGSIMLITMHFIFKEEPQKLSWGLS